MSRRILSSLSVKNTSRLTMARMRFRGGALILLFLAAAALVAGVGDVGEARKDDKPPPKKTPLPFELRGRLVCLPEEMRDRYGASVPPIHDHALGFRAEEAVPAGIPAYYTILRTSLSEGLFVDERFRAHTLVLSGRRFPDTAIVEITSCRWLKDGKLYDVYYWCEVCSIKGMNPGPCACCQGKVELRESPAAGGGGK